VRNEKILEIGSARNPLFLQLSRLEREQELPDVPVMPETLLLMELMVRERTVDLGELSQLVLGDLGAAIQIMRLAGSEESLADARLARIEDCISGLGLEACLDAVSKQTLKRSARHPGMNAMWTHAREIAEICRTLAAESPLSANPEDAYLVGLFHAIGCLPVVLEWDRTTYLPDEPELAGLRMAQAWVLPPCVIDYFSELRPLSNGNRWRRLVERAHALDCAQPEAPLPLQKHSTAWMHSVSS
jgi:HD-like signal output (HDOD) protein